MRRWKTIDDVDARPSAPPHTRTADIGSTRTHARTTAPPTARFGISPACLARRAEARRRESSAQPGFELVSRLDRDVHRQRRPPACCADSHRILLGCHHGPGAALPARRCDLSRDPSACTNDDRSIAFRHDIPPLRADGAKETLRPRDAGHGHDTRPGRSGASPSPSGRGSERRFDSERCHAPSTARDTNDIVAGS